MREKQIDFPEGLKHSRTTEMVLWGVAILCILFVILAVQIVGGGGI